MLCMPAAIAQSAMGLLEAWLAAHGAGADAAAGSSPRGATSRGAPAAMPATGAAATSRGGGAGGVLAEGSGAPDASGVTPVPLWVNALLLALDVLLQERAVPRAAEATGARQVHILETFASSQGPALLVINSVLHLLQG